MRFKASTVLAIASLHVALGNVAGGWATPLNRSTAVHLKRA
jgi:hypothetical protein